MHRNIKYNARTCVQKRDDGNKYSDNSDTDKETTDIVDITTAFIFIAKIYAAFDKVHVKHCRVIGSLKN